MAAKDWWFGESSLWGELTGKKARGEAERSQRRAQAALERNLTLARTQIEGMPTFQPGTPGEFSEFELPEAIRRRMAIIRGRSGEAITGQVQRSLGGLSRAGLATSGVGQALAADIRRKGGQAIGERLGEIEGSELDKARSAFEWQERQKEAGRYRQFQSEAAKAMALANLYKTRAGAESRIAGQQLPTTRSGLNVLLDVGSRVLPYL